MVSFRSLWEELEKQKHLSPLMGSGEDSKTLAVVRTGKEMRKEDESQFWDEFISLCSNADGLAELLDVNPEKVRSWPNKIHDALQQLEQHHLENPSEEEKAEVVPTGDNGAITTNVDPYLGEQ